MNTAIGAVPPVFAAGQGCHLVDREGRAYLDLINGFGSVFLGHANPKVAEAMSRQARTLVNSGRLGNEVVEQVMERLGSLLPDSMYLGGLYSTGMESLEFALRVASANTGKDRFLSFSRSMHGKSVATANLGWDNALLGWGLETRLDYPLPDDFNTTLVRVEQELASGQFAGLLVEPMQGSNNGRSFTPGQLGALWRLCREHGVLVIVDETLTGLYRTGPRFYSDDVGMAPDLLVFAKSLGNGFPASAVGLGRTLGVPGAVLPGSTFSSTPLVAAVILAVLDDMPASLGVDRIAALEGVVLAALGPGQDIGCAVLRGKGAMWLLQTSGAEQAEFIQHTLFQAGALVGRMGSVLRLLPQSGTRPEELHEYCEMLRGLLSAG